MRTPIAAIDHVAEEFHAKQSIWHRIFWGVPLYIIITFKKSRVECSKCWVTAYDVIEIIEESSGGPHRDLP